MTINTRTKLKHIASTVEVVPCDGSELQYSTTEHGQTVLYVQVMSMQTMLEKIKFGFT